MKSHAVDECRIANSVNAAPPISAAIPPSISARAVRSRLSSTARAPLAANTNSENPPRAIDGEPEMRRTSVGPSAP